MKFSMVARVIGLLRVENLLYLRFSSQPTRTLLCHRPQDLSDSVDDASDRLTLQATVDDTGDKVATCLLRVRGRLPLRTRRDESCGGRLSGEAPVACLPFIPPCRPFPSMSASSSSEACTDFGSQDEALLASLGYKQEFKRDFSPLQVFGLGFSIIGVVPSVW